jgi:hypothetical protein
MTEEKSLEGLGGWLILVGLGIVLSPLRIVYFIIQTYSEVFTNGSWEILTTPGNASYNHLWAPLLIGELAINIGLLLTWVFIAYLFFTKKRLFPKFYIAILLFTLAFILIDSLAMKSVLPDEPVFDEATIMEFVRSLIASLIWVPYMLVSKRVKATFVK